MKQESPIRWTLLLAALVLLGWMAFAVWPRLLTAVGIADFGRWFLDSHAVLAAGDALRAGLDPNEANPFDPLLRNHKYSDWWHVLGALGLTRDDNFLVGALWVGGFLLAALLTARPAGRGETGWLALFLLSPPVILVVNRANNDLVIFVLLAAGAAAAGVAWWRRILAALALALATGLKFYPVAAAGAMLWVRPARRMPVGLALALLAAVIALASVWPQVVRGQFFVESSLHTFGAALLVRDLGGHDDLARWLAPLAVGLGGLALALGGFTTGLARRDDGRLPLLAAMGLIVLLACFAAGVSYAYRWIFAWWMALWLWREAGSAAGPIRARRTARVACLLLAACLWLDGSLSFMVNRVLPPLGSVAEMAALQRHWRLATQPLHWGLMALFAGWLLEAVAQIGREWWTERRTAA